MSILVTDLEYRFSSPTASAGNQLAQIDPAASLGRFLSTSIWHGGSLHDLFQRLTGDENAAHEVEYRCLFIVNKHASLTWQSPVIWLTASGTGLTLPAIGVDTVAASALTSTSPQSLTVANLVTPPAGVTFSAPTSKGAGLALGDIPSGFCKAVWFRRTATGSAAANNDGFSVRYEGDTGA